MFLLCITFFLWGRRLFESFFHSYTAIFFRIAFSFSSSSNFSSSFLDALACWNDDRLGNASYLFFNDTDSVILSVASLRRRLLGFGRQMVTRWTSDRFPPVPYAFGLWWTFTVSEVVKVASLRNPVEEIQKCITTHCFLCLEGFELNEASTRFVERTTISFRRG